MLSLEAVSPENDLLTDYRPTADAFDEYFDVATGKPWDHVRLLIDSLARIGRQTFSRLHHESLDYLERRGVTFTLTADSSSEAEGRILPTDLLPRCVSRLDWLRLQRGLQQRVAALNYFIADVYSGRKIFIDRVIPTELTFSSRGYFRELDYITPPGGTYIHVAGVDLARGPNGAFIVLEDNLRVPSGVAYALTNRLLSKRYLPNLVLSSAIEPVHEYPGRLASGLRKLASWSVSPLVVLLTPGARNSAYFEHCYLAQAMGAELVISSDLFVENDTVFLRSLPHPKRVDAIYRRVDDSYLDPTALRQDSLVGVPGLLRAYASGNLVLANSPGNGVADDKAVFAYVPHMIRYYLSEEPILEQAETFVCALSKQREHVLRNLSQFVIKPVSGSGGEGIFFGPAASKAEQERMAGVLRAAPRDFVGQPFFELSRVPTFVDGQVSPRRVDLRPFVLLSGADLWVMPGGLTRVASRESSYLVNSSAGGGSKDTWVGPERTS
jgi:uncharacterized circularly permuted ATP-grasp superfamily protein